LTTRKNPSIPVVAARPWSWLVLALALAVLFPPASRADPVARFTFSPSSPLTNEQITFTSISTGVTSQSWDLDGDRSCNDATGPSAQWSFPMAGIHQVTLCVSDEARQQGSQTLNITVQNRPPAAAFTFTPPAPFTGDTIILTSISADPDGPIASLRWELDGDTAFDDGTGPTAAVSFPAAGQYPLRLLVTDRDGATAIASATVAVRERPAEPISPFPVVSMLAAVGQQGTTIQELVVKAPAGARVRVRCRGAGCPFRSFAQKAGTKAHSARIVRIHRFGQHLLRPGTVIEIRVTARGEVGKYTRFVIRKGRPPKRVDRCLVPGSKRPVRCPSA
jgi:PKD repeat protein